MSDPVITEQPRGTVGVTRKVNLGNFESEEVSVFIQFPVTFDDEAGTVTAANDAAFQAKTVVYAQLGIDGEYVDGVLRVKAVFPGSTVTQATTVVSSPPQAAIPAASTAAPSAPAASGSPASSGAEAVCPKCGSGLYDNRPKNVERLAAGQKAIPEGRCKQYADAPKGTGCKGVIWSFSKGA